MICARDNIRLTCLADGKLLSFLSPAQTYSLFGNMLDNAIEAVRLLTDESKRIISLTVRDAGDAVEIESVNYCADERDITENIPQTSKTDRNKHGYGIKNMKYITEQYGGTLYVKASAGTFTLRIRMPKRATPPPADKRA